MPDKNKVPPKDVIVTYHYFTFKKVDGDNKTLKATRLFQKVEIAGFTWILRDIYGNDDESTAGASLKTINLNSFKNECLMCYAEATDVMIYPCRHLSIGLSCAQQLRNNPKKNNECPVCRGRIERFVKINLTGKAA